MKIFIANFMPGGGSFQLGSAGDWELNLRVMISFGKYDRKHEMIKWDSIIVEIIHFWEPVSVRTDTF